MRFTLAFVLVWTLVAGSAEAAAEPPSTEQSEVEARLRDAYTLVPGLAEVRATARGGVVLLEGKAPTAEARAAAEKIASGAPGVAYVSNAIEVTSAEQRSERRERSDEDLQIQERLKGVYSQVDELGGVSVSVNSGVVRLAGKTSSRDAIERAEQLATKTAGVVYVDNDIAESSEVDERVEPAVERLERMWQTLIARLPLIGVALFVLVCAYLLARALARSERVFGRVVKNRMLRGIVQQMVATAVVVAALVLVLDLLEATALVSAILGAAGLAGIAVGFAFREIGENYLASFLLGLRRPFAPNDHVVIGSQEGKVLRLTTRETILLSLDGNHVRLPNAEVFKSVITNYSQNPLRRLSFDAGIGSEAALTEAQRVGVEALGRTPGVVSEPGPFARVEELAASSVVVRYFAWVDQRSADWYKVRSEAIRRTKAALEEAGVSLPVPIYRIESHAAQDERRSAREPEEQECEVGIDRILESQIEAEKLRSDEENLLENDTNRGVRTAAE